MPAGASAEAKKKKLTPEQELAELRRVNGDELRKRGIKLDEVEHVTPSLWLMVVPIGTLKLDPRNARKHGERNRKSIRHSLTQFGQQKPISVDADGIILAGNGTFAEGVAMGWKWIAVAKSHLRGAEARAFALADNRTAELAEWDIDELTASLDEIDEAGINVDGLEITEEDVEKMIEELEGSDDSNNGAGSSRSGKGSGGEIKEQWKVVVECGDGEDQIAFLNQMKQQGRKCRALVG